MRGCRNAYPANRQPRVVVLDRHNAFLRPGPAGAGRHLRCETVPIQSMDKTSLTKPDQARAPLQSRAFLRELLPMMQFQMTEPSTRGRLDHLDAMRAIA